MQNIKPPRGEALLLLYVTARTQTKHELPLKVKGGREAPHHVLTTALLKKIIAINARMSFFVAHCRCFFFFFYLKVKYKKL